MNPTIARLVVSVLASVAAATALAAESDCEAQARRQRVQVVTGLRGCVAFWDFVQREPDGRQRFTAHVPPGAANDFPLDAGNYVKDFWGQGREATYADFPQMGRGPFGNAVRIVKETDPDFGPFLFVLRERLHDSPLDIKGAGKSVTVVVWAIRESGNHALAGIWHEGTDVQQKETAFVQKVQRGQRQYALFAGLNKEGWERGYAAYRPSYAALGLVIAWGHYLNIFHLMYSGLGAVSGAGWTDVHARLPAYWPCGIPSRPWPMRTNAW